jgi:tetratricopeptide (TPR) repeat protein
MGVGYGAPHETAALMGPHTAKGSMQYPHNCFSIEREGTTMLSGIRTSLPSLIAFFVLYQIATASAAQYVLNGMPLGYPISLKSSDYKSYKCEQNDDSFEGYTWCERKQGGVWDQKPVVRSAILHSKDGVPVYLMSDVAKDSLDRQAVEKEIGELSKQFNENPTKVEWLPQQASLPTSVVVTWGNIYLRKVDVSIDPKANYTDDDLSDQVSHDAFVRNDDLLLDFLGDLPLSLKAGLPIYRIGGGAGFVYRANLDKNGKGRLHYVASNFSQPAIKEFEPRALQILRKDQSLPQSDYGLWPDFANAARKLYLTTSPKIATEELDKIFGRYPSTKLRSHVWLLLPLGTAATLAQQFYWAEPVYGPNTQYRGIRNDITEFLSKNPSEHFREFLYFTIGEFDKAQQENPQSIIASPIRYAIGHKLLLSLLITTAKTVGIKPAGESFESAAEPVNAILGELNDEPERYGNKLLHEIVPDFDPQAAAAELSFKAVLQDTSSPLADDAAYMLGWLAFHEGKLKEASAYMAKAMTVGNGDYSRPAIKHTMRILARFTPREQANIVSADPIYAKQPALWYVAARSAYREFDYDLVIETGERGLKNLEVSSDRLPASTNPDIIQKAIEKNIPKRVLEGDNFDEANLVEIPYIVEASKEMKRYETYIKSIATEPPEVVGKRAKDIIVKYSLLLDKPEKLKRGPGPVPVHKDLRQAVHLIDTTLQNVPQTQQYALLREWLYYRKVRILVQFAPETVPDAVAAMEVEYPKSRLLNNAMAEEIFAEGVVLRNVALAEKTFHKLLDTFPKGNAVDNAYSWMAIIYRCAGKLEQAEKTNKDIIRLFPMARHAKYAKERMSHPNDCGLNEEDSDN